MARSTQTIQAAIIAAIQADPILSPLLTSKSKVSLWNLFAAVIAQAINTLEQLIDGYATKVNTITAQAYYGTPPWWQQQMFKFQYSDTVPQTIQLINNVLKYPVVDPTLNIITACSVQAIGGGGIVFKVASGPPGNYNVLTDPQKDAAQNYVHFLAPAGISVQVQSYSADRVYIKANIYYEGQYGAYFLLKSIEDLITNHLSSLDFTGNFKVSNIISLILSIPGVQDCSIENLSIALDGRIVADGAPLVSNYSTLNKSYPYGSYNSSLYYILENTPGFTLADSLKFVAV